MTTSEQKLRRKSDLVIDLLCAEIEDLRKRWKHEEATSARPCTLCRRATGIYSVPIGIALFYLCPKCYNERSDSEGAATQDEILRGMVNAPQAK